MTRTAEHPDGRVIDCPGLRPLQAIELWRALDRAGAV
jgi:hypothetical protein